MFVNDAYRPDHRGIEIRDLNDGGDVSRDADAWLALGIGVIVIAAAPLLHTVSPILAIGSLGIVGMVVMTMLPAQAPFLAIVWILFQNVFVSIFSPLIAAPSDLEIIKGYNFLLCATVWLAGVLKYAMNIRNCPPELRRLMTLGWLTLGVISIFFAIGFVATGMAAVIYLRNIVFPVLLFQIFLVSAAYFKVRLRPILTIITVCFICCGYVEFFFRDFWLHMTNGEAYWRFEEIKAAESGVWEREMRATGNVIVTLKDRFTISFLNTPLLQGLGLPDLLRIFGPNLHAISFAYGLMFFILLFVSIGSPWLAAAAMPLAILSGVKGPLILMAFVAGSWILTRLIGAVRTIVIGLIGLCAYIGTGIYLGLQIGDYHVIGFMGGWNGLLTVPFGRGIGFGGNLTQDFSSIDWSVAQQAGAVDGAFESAVGVLLYQMGIGALVPLGFTLYIAYRIWLLYARSGDLIQGFAAFGLLLLLVNGVFQEEALFSPMALGLLMSLAGFVLGKEIRQRANHPFENRIFQPDGSGLRRIDPVIT